ncbi:bifunctional oligoribonuclease/PAP phosphatase NrnA [Patescibacteria group bacterium]|nr:bifunctional oligoribonuclease/PAP phosphatase NrnA [Patescibacteria group bacterium]
MATHPRTDGDDCGSMLAFSIALKKMGKQTTMAAKFGMPAALNFLPNHQEVLDAPTFPVDKTNYDAVILFGCSNKPRVGFEQIKQSSLPILNIDHHPDNELFGQVNLVDMSKSSVAELVYDFFNATGIEIDNKMAKCLLTGMFTDTGSFMHSNTMPSTLIAAGQLMKHGARIDQIYEATYKNKDLAALKAWAKAIDNTRVIKNGKIAISVITKEDFDQLGKVPENAFDGFVETLNGIPGTKFALFLRQEGASVKGSLRSEEAKNMDVSFVAHLMGGGGHKLSSGFEIQGKIVKDPETGWRIQTT